MSQEMNIYTFRNLDLETLRETLIKSFQHPFFDVEKRMFGSKESFDADIPRILNRKERRRLKAKDKRKGLSKSKEKAIELIKEIKDFLFLTKEMYMGKDELLTAYMDLNMQRCDDALKELEEEVC